MDQIADLPPGIADGVDDVGESYQAGHGLLLDGANTFSVDETIVAPADHTHPPPGFSEIAERPRRNLLDGTDDVGVASVTAGAGLVAGSTTGGDVTVSLDAHTHSWTELTDVPADFADGVDDASGGPRGVVFTRWGRNDCPTGTSLVYEGYAAGSHYTHFGGGSNTLCLHGTPEWADFSDADENGGLLYGVEFEMAGYGLSGTSPFNTLHDDEGLCAVCLDGDADLQIMLPGRQSCPAGWTPRVQGYLMSNEYTQHKSEFLCIDGDSMAGGSPGDSNGSLWYPVEGECGSLPCGPGQYVQNREITCAICTR